MRHLSLLKKEIKNESKDTSLFSSSSKLLQHNIWRRGIKIKKLVLNITRMTTLTEQEVLALQQRIAEQELRIRDQQARLDANTKPITDSKPTMAAANHEALTTFIPGRDQATVGDRWEKWLQVWDLYLASQGLDEKEDIRRYNKPKRSVFAYVSLFC
jgi:hypothetical protein